MRATKRMATQLTIAELYDNYTTHKYSLGTPLTASAAPWTAEQQSAFLDSVFHNDPALPIVLRRSRESGIEILDGRQRIKTIIDFVENQTPIPENVVQDFGEEMDGFERGSEGNGITREKLQAAGCKELLRRFWQYEINVEFLYEDDDGRVREVLRRYWNLA